MHNLIKSEVASDIIISESNLKQMHKKQFDSLNIAVEILTKKLDNILSKGVDDMNHANSASDYNLLKSQQVFLFLLNFLFI